ncbi:MAG: alpha amylase C-terminal domain-containing protein, partial [Lachnospiraceae bacterium]|nr:alpha amylase C-terminal domain-containing protein [Lachnospiraceae bacterium]
LYRKHKALYELDNKAAGFEWINNISANDCYLTYLRKGTDAEDTLLVVANFSGVEKEITTGVPYEGKYKELLNTDAVKYGGSGIVNSRIKQAQDTEWDDRRQSVTVKLAPLSLSILQFVPYTEEELEKVIAQRIRKSTPIKKSTSPKKNNTQKSVEK